MRAWVKSIALVGIAASTLAARPAAAQQKSEADKLFDEGAALMKENRYGEACAKFAASNRLDPEIGGLLWLADCYSRNGQIASSYKTYKDAQKMALDRKDKKQRDKVAERHIEELEPRLTKLAIVVPHDQRVPGLVVSRDANKVDPAEFGLAQPIDPGSFTITATAPNYEKWSQKVDASGEGQTATVTVGPLVKIAIAQPGPPPNAPDPAFVYHVGGIVTGAIGLVAIGVGSAFGLIAGDHLKESNSTHCDINDTCDAVGLQLRSEAKDAALASTILFVAGGVALAAGITIFLLAPHKKTTTAPVFGYIAPAVGDGLYGAVVGGSF
ncbi:MAG TPA: hypothetical protein VGH28_12420 [Polyangiaceae bacterium]|jgi:hypothetical protein